MGFNLQKSTKKSGNIQSEINITPFVDVMLVLLIIFMVTAPFLFNGVSLTLPKTQKVQNLRLNEQQVILSIPRENDYYLGKKKVLKTELVAEIQAQLKQNKSEVLYLRADYSLRYGVVAKLMAFLKGHGIVHIAIVTELEKS